MIEKVFVLTSQTFTLGGKDHIQIEDQLPVSGVFATRQRAIEYAESLLQSFLGGRIKVEIEKYRKCDVFEWAASVCVDRTPWYTLTITQQYVLP